MVFSHLLPRCLRGGTKQQIEERNIFHVLEYSQPIKDGMITDYLEQIYN